MTGLSRPTPQGRVEDFLKTGLYLRNWSPKTVRCYQQALSTIPETLTKQSLEAWVIERRQQGLTPGGINLRLRSINSFLSWMRGEGDENVPPKVKLLKAPLKHIETLSPADLKALLLFKPKFFGQWRAWTLILLLLDTGVRIDEALSLEKARVNLDSMVLVVMGKGSKERQLPFSMEMRKHL